MSEHYDRIFDPDIWPNIVGRQAPGDVYGADRYIEQDYQSIGVLGKSARRSGIGLDGVEEPTPTRAAPALAVFLRAYRRNVPGTMAYRRVLVAHRASLQGQPCSLYTRALRLHLQAGGTPPVRGAARRRPLGAYDPSAIIPDYRGQSFYASEDVPDYRTAIMQPSQTAAAIARIAGSGEGGYGNLPRGRRRRQEARKYAQHAAFQLWNPTLPAAERGALMTQLRAIGAPVGGTSDSVARALSFGPAAIGAPVGLVGTRAR